MLLSTAFPTSTRCPWSVDLGSRPTARPQRTRRCVIASSVDDDDVPQIMGDWRDFRARLVATTTSEPASVRRCEENMKLLEIQNPKLAAEGLWSHPVARPEKGGLLIASAKVAELTGNSKYEQVVMLLTDHGEQGSIGLILNRPTGMVMGRKPGGMPFQVANAPPVLQQAFSENRLYCGGFTAQNVIHLIHGHRLPKAVEVVPGVFMGGEVAAAEEVCEGRLPAEDFRFFAGAVVFDAGEVDRQAKSGAWYPAACSRSLVLKQCLQLPTPLWREVMLLLGGQYQEEAERVEDSGE